MDQTPNEVFYQLLVDPVAANYNNPGQLKQFAIYPAKAVFTHTDGRGERTIELVAAIHRHEWRRLELNLPPTK